jgi:hypothetical protein
MMTDKPTPCALCAVRDADIVQRFAHINRSRRFVLHELQEAIEVIKSDMPKEEVLDFLHDAIALLNEMQPLLQLSTKPEGE